MRELADPAERPRTPPAIQLLVGAGVAGALVAVSAFSFILFHSLAELFAIIIGASLFLVAWNSRRIVSDSFLVFLGAGYLAVSTIDLLHLLSFPGLNVLGDSRGLSSQLWLAARATEGFALLVAPVLLRRRVRPVRVVMGFGISTALLLAAIWGGVFPDTVSGDRLTPFKSIAEVVIALAMIAATFALWRKRDYVDPTALRLVIASIAVRVLSELSFVLYVDPYGPANLVGHILKVAATFLLYKALIENLLMRPYALLFRSLKEREEQLRTAAGELETFSYAVSHDLRTPLTTVSGYAELMLHDPARLSETERDYLTQIVQGSKRMANIIDDLLRLAQLSRGAVDLAPVDISSLCHDVVDELRRSEPGRRVDVEIESGVSARADQRLLRSALENLVGNAWKFTSKSEDARITIGIRREPGGEAALYVRDNGAGFDPARAERLFSPFIRLHSHKDFAGTGVGLATVQRIVQRHGGTVWAEGEPGKGATFYVRLPELKRVER